MKGKGFRRLLGVVVGVPTLGGVGASSTAVTRVLLVRSLLWWLGGYVAITVVNSALTLGYGFVLAASRGDAGFDLAYERTAAAHIVIGVALWALAGLGMWRGCKGAEQTARTSALVSSVWLAVSVLADAVVFVGLLSDTPAGAPAEVFYVDNQPWTALYYVAVVVGPPAALVWWRFYQRQADP